MKLRREIPRTILHDRAWIYSKTRSAWDRPTPLMMPSDHKEAGSTPIGGTNSTFPRQTALIPQVQAAPTELPHNVPLAPARASPRPLETCGVSGTIIGIS